MKARLLLIAAALYLTSSSAQTQAPPPMDDHEKVIAAEIGKLRSLPDDEWTKSVGNVATQIQKLPASPGKIALISRLANLVTEGDAGQETLQVVASTLADVMQAAPNVELYDALARLVHYEHCKASLDNPKYRDALAKMEEDDQRRQSADLTLTDLKGASWSLKSLRGKVVMVNFWATWCPPCREEIPDLIALQTRYRGTLQIIGIAQDSGTADEVKRFVRDHGMNYPSLLSTPEIERLFPPVSALPTSFFLDRDGRIAQKHVGMLNPSLTDLETQALAGTNPDLQIVDAEDEEKARVASAAQANKIPGIDLSGLSPDKRAKVLAALNSEHCTCGCGLTLAQCRVDDPTCDVSLPLAQDLFKKIASAK